MGGTTSVAAKPEDPPEEIAEFRKLGGFRQLDGPTEQCIIPEVPENRQPTNVKFTIAFAASTALFLVFLIYTLAHADINKLIHGYDDCGNICGSTNAKIDDISCSGKDETNKTFLRLHPSQSKILSGGSSGVLDTYTFIPGECVSDCYFDDVIVMNRCYPRDEAYTTKDVTEFLKNIGDDLNKSAGRIVGLCFIGLGLCVISLLLFRYFVAETVWAILIGSIIGSIALSVYFWILTNETTEFMKDKNNQTYVYALAIGFSAFSLVLIGVLIFAFAKIKLIVRLFEESIKIIFDMPLILLQPLMSILASLILLTIFLFLPVWLNTVSVLEPVGYPFYDYVLSDSTIFAIYLHLVICLWFSQFILGCQQMVIAGAVSAHYFSKDKSTLTSPIYNSFYNLIRYHLGTVACGSLIITVVVIIKAMIRRMVHNKYLRLFIECWLSNIENLLKYLTKNAYILTAMHGQPFFRSGKRAVRLLYANAISALAVNFVGAYILFMTKVFIIGLTIFVGVLIHDDSNPYWGNGVALAAIVTAILAHCFFTVFKTTIDTLFLCFCEDQCMNDGMTRPYYTSVYLIQYMEEAKSKFK